MERIAGHYDKIILTLIMCLAILFMATFSPLAESANAVAIEASIIAIIIAGLSALGITFVVTGAYDNLNDYVSDLFNDFATSQSTTPQALLKGCQSGGNKLGQILLNNRFVIVLEMFAAYLIQRFSLTNNNITNVVATGATINGLTAYELPFEIMNEVWGRKWDIYIGNGAYLIWGLWSNGEAVSPRFYSETAGTIQRVTIRPDGTINNPTNFELTYNDSLGLYTGADTTAYGINNYPQLQSVTAYSNDYLNSLENAVIDENNIGIDIVTDNILLPSDDSNYTDGDGAIIDLDADWGTTYQDVIDDVIPDEFSDSKEGSASIEYVTEEEVGEAVDSTSEITNLPAGTIPFTPLQLPELQLSSIWHYVAQWISDTAIACGSLMAIVIQEPSPMVNLFYATVCLAIIFGVIKGVAK